MGCARWAPDPTKWTPVIAVLSATVDFLSHSSFFAWLETSESTGGKPFGGYIDTKQLCKAWEELTVSGRVFWLQYGSPELADSMCAKCDTLKSLHSTWKHVIIDKIRAESLTVAGELEVAVRKFTVESDHQQAKEVKVAVESLWKSVNDFTILATQVGTAPEEMPGLKRCTAAKNVAQNMTVGWAVSTLLKNKLIRDTEKGVSLRKQLKDILDQQLKGKDEEELKAFGISTEAHAAAKEVIQMKNPKKKP